jgi:hypothetical protein
MPRHRVIELRFIRRQSTDAARDDVLRITRIDDNLNRVVYTEKSNETTAAIDIMTYNNQQLLSYLYRVFWLTNIDEDPFSSMQLFVPGFPTCMMSVTALKQNIPSVMDCIGSTYLHWPIIGQERDEAVRVGCHSLTVVRSPEQTANGGDNGNSANSC